MENLYVVLTMLAVSILLIWGLYQFLKRDGAKESLFMQVVLFVPRIITNLFHALTMDEKGYSLKKILAVVSTEAARELSMKFVSAQNVILLVIIWLVYAGILVGIYSIGDISNAVKNAKNGNNPTPAQP